MSSIDWLGGIPAHWEVIPLRFLTTFSGGATPDTQNVDYWSGTIPWVSPKDMKRDFIDDAEDHVSEAALDNSALKMIEPESILVVVRGMILAHSFPTAINTVPVTINQDMKALSCGTKIEPAFLVDVLKGAKDYLVTLADSSAHGTKKLETEVLGRLEVPVPPIDEQRKIVQHIANETADIDALIAAKQLLLDLLAEKRRAFVVEMIMRGVNPAAPLRPSGIDWFGDIPAHWQVRRVASLFKQRDERSQPDLPLLEVSINSGVIVREFSNDKIEGTASDFNTYKVAKRGDIAFNKMRMWQGAVGVVPVDGLVSPDYTVAEAKDDLRPEYAGQLFRTDAFSAECGRNSQGITWDRLRLYWDSFRDIFIPVPPLLEQDDILSAIATETAKIDRLQAATEHSITLLKERRGALIAAAVTGQIDIPEAA
jgi:type I restriction enzyme, S subunit